MDSNFSSRPNKKGSEQGRSETSSVLVLHNDDVNSFEFVMDSLKKVCNHSEIQAEQCAMITHYKGKCEIVVGERNNLYGIKQKLVSIGLIVSLE
jgi:ATP-dependent Clp protease adaptor protein ClpS